MTMQSPYPYGSIKEAVREWVEALPVGRDFHYGEAAEELELKLPTVSQILLKMIREDDPPLLTYGRRAGRYRRITPEQRAIPVETAEGAESALVTDGPGRQPEPKGPRADDLMTVIGKKKTGSPCCCADEEGILWEATPV